MDNFSDPDFLQRFAARRYATDSVNINLDQAALSALLPNPAGAKILDIGSGFGDTAAELTTRGAIVTSIDPSKQMVTHAREKYPDLAERFHIGRVEDTGWTNEFDVVVSCLVLHLVEDLGEFLGAASRALKKGGTLILSQRHPVRTCNPGYSGGEDVSDWKVSGYFSEGRREYAWLDKPTVGFHRSIETIFGQLTKCGLQVVDLREPQPAAASLSSTRLSECHEVPAILTLKCTKLRDAVSTDPDKSG
jgi:SAM-dependent methyltransferase